MPADPAVIRVPFEYVFNGVIPASGTLNGAIQIQQDADFEWVWRISTSDQSTGTPQAPSFTILITDLATGRVLMNLPVDDTNYFGTAQLPFPNLEPYIFARSSSIGLTLVDVSTHTNTVQIVFGGYKLFPASAQGQGSSGALVQMS